MEHPLNESAWRRGWNDTKKVRTSWQFYVLDAVVLVVIGGIFEWYWGLLIVIFGMLCVWMGAVASAPIRQRNEARALLLAKPKAVPLRNRESLIRAIALVQEKVITLKTSQDWLYHKEKFNDDSQKARSARDEAHSAYLNALEGLETEQLVAGDYFRAIIDNLRMFINYHIYDSMGATKDKPATLKTIPFISEVDNKIKQTIRSLDALSLQAFDK